MEEVWGLPGALDGVSFAGGTDSGIAARVGPDRDPAPMAARYLEHLAALTAERDDLQPLPGAVALLDALGRAGAQVALLTGNLRAGARMKLEAVGLAGRFDWALSAFAEDGEARTAIAAAARRRCGEGPLTVVGDTVHDITCARHIGARVLCVATGAHERDQLRAAEPDRLVDDLSATADLAAWLLARP